MPKNRQRKQKKNARSSATAESQELQPTAMRVTYPQDSKQNDFCEITHNMTVTVSNGRRVITGPWDEMCSMLRSAAAKWAAQKNADAGTTTAAATHAARETAVTEAPTPA